MLCCAGIVRVWDWFPPAGSFRLDHLGIWLVGSRPPPKIHDPPVCMHSTGRPAAPYSMEDVSQLPVNDDHLYRDPDYSWDEYIQAYRFENSKN
jgi:hypothetical protein